MTKAIDIPVTSFQVKKPKGKHMDQKREIIKFTTQLWDVDIDLIYSHGSKFIPVKTICEAFQLDPEVELNRIFEEDNYLVDHLMFLRDQETDGSDTKIWCLDMSAVPIFICGLKQKEPPTLSSYSALYLVKDLLFRLINRELKAIY